MLRLNDDLYRLRLELLRASMRCVGSLFDFIDPGHGCGQVAGMTGALAKSSGRCSYGFLRSALA